MAQKTSTQMLSASLKCKTAFFSISLNRFILFFHRIEEVEEFCIPFDGMQFEDKAGQTSRGNVYLYVAVQIDCHVPQSLINSVLLSLVENGMERYSFTPDHIKP